MDAHALDTGPAAAVIRRLSGFAPLTGEERERIASSVARTARSFPRYKVIVAEGEDLGRPMMLVDGWAARVRQLRDGRRQILSLLLPGELFGLCSHPSPLAISTLVAMTPVTFADAPEAAEGTPLARAYSISLAREQVELADQIVRLGRLTAFERVGDLLLDLGERLRAGGNREQGGFTLPVTQETLGDLIGLTGVHVNRTFRAMREKGLVDLQGGFVSIPDPDALAGRIGRRRIGVSKTR